MSAPRRTSGLYDTQSDPKPALVAPIAAQANSTLRRSEHIHLTPHVVRHAALRAAAEKKRIRYAMRLAGHTSSRYNWRYAQPSDDGLDEAVEEMS